MKNISFTVLGLAAGIAVPIMAALNAKLGLRMGNPFGAAAVLCAVAFIACVGAYAITAPQSGSYRLPAANTEYAAGLLFVVYIASITWLAPRLGLANAVFLVLMGQLLSSAVIDHFALFGAPKVEITARRVLGLVVMAVGLFLARRPI